MLASSRGILTSHQPLQEVQLASRRLPSANGLRITRRKSGLVKDSIAPCTQMQVPVEHLLHMFHNSGSHAPQPGRRNLVRHTQAQCLTHRPLSASTDALNVFRDCGNIIDSRTRASAPGKQISAELHSESIKARRTPPAITKKTGPFVGSSTTRDCIARSSRSEAASPSTPTAPPTRELTLGGSIILAPGEESRAERCAHVVPPPSNGATREMPKVSSESLQYEEGLMGAISEKTPPAPDDECLVDPSCSAMGYLRRILTSRVYDVAIESPLEPAPRLSEKLGTQILLKREDMQQVFSFKLRGAYNMMAQLPRATLDRGVITSSAGNHAQGVALSARTLGCRATIAMPVTTPEIKWRSVERLGAEVVLVGDSYDETQAYVKRRAAADNFEFVPPFDHPDVIAGQGTVGMEILRQHPGPLHAVFVPVGGGGLIAGIAAYIKRLRPEVRIIGVEPSDANAMALSLHRGERVMLESVGGFADGVAVKTVGEETFRICRELVDGIVLVSKDSICAAIKDMFEETRSILEPAGALSLAGAKAYARHYGLGPDSAVVAVTSGANMNFERLRLVTELADVGLKREAVLATAMPEVPGAFKRFCQTVGPDINITEFKYRYASERQAHVLYSVGLHRVEEVAALRERMMAAGMHTVDMTTNDLAKQHLRHLVGGRTTVADEILYRFVFPERPGAVLKFLDMLSPRWNITLFHYRSQGEMGANVLVGLQVPPEQEAEFQAAAAALGYDYQDERNNEAFHMFMR